MLHLSAGTLVADPVSPLILSDRLITLAIDADRAGLTGTAGRLVKLACAVLDEARKRNAETAIPRGMSGD
jgi:hypothetical protein